MNFNDLLKRQNLDSQKILVLRHRPKDRELRKVMPWLAAEKPKVFNEYQQTQTPKVEKQMQKADYVASFFGHESGKALLVGLYKVRGSELLSTDKVRKSPAFQELINYGHQTSGTRKKVLRFNLELTKHFLDWKGKLIIRWPTPELVWSRWAAKNDFAIDAILEESCLEGRMPHWRQLCLTWEELQAIPKTWRSALSQWRGIYFILDVSDGKGYVGSAYGNDNLLGRWLTYAKTGHGGNKLLRGRNPANFRFSILERVSPDMDVDAIVERENTWKTRLHTCEHGLNVN